jgi:ABC-type nickel/cobalt efflux system permease component RcnA
MTASLLGMLLGVALGARHALEPDHLAAVSVLSAESPNVGRGALLGACWGIGHTLSLLIVALVLALLSASMPAALTDVFELGVAAMLVILGVRSVQRAVRDGRAGPSQLHHHGHAPHVHAGPAAHLHLGRWTLAARPLLVGLVHGLAGSGALTALAVAEIPSPSARIAFIVFFGVGSVIGMTALSGLAGWPLARLGRTPRAARTLGAITGVLSTCFGVAWGWPLIGRVFG